MARKKNKNNDEERDVEKSVSNHTKQAILAICVFLLALLSVLAAFGKAGVVGEYTFRILSKFFGIGYYLIPIVLCMLGISFIQGIKAKIGYSKVVGAVLFLVSGLGILDLFPEDAGGIFGRWIALPLIRLMDLWATSLLLVAVLAISLLITFDIKLTWENLAFWKKWKEEKEVVNEKEDGIDKAVASAEANIMDSIVPGSARALALEEAKAREKAMAEKSSRNNKKGLLDFSDSEESGFASAVTMPMYKEFNPPPLSLLEKDRGKPETGDIKANANIIKRTLQNFNITVEMDEISIGPSVTRYALKPAEGVTGNRWADG